MKINLSKFLLGWGVATLAGINAEGATIISDNYNTTGSGSGFALGSGANSGINPPTTRLTGGVAAGLRYINTGTKATSAYTITSNKLRVTAAANPGRFVLSADGTTPFNFGPAFGIGAATPGNPSVYDISISMDNDSTGTQRFSFALGTAESDANSWDFGFQVYRAASGNNFYTIGKRIDTAASGLGADLNAAIYTTTASTYGTEITILMRVTDAGAETTTYNSRVQLSLNGGSTWFYDTDTDSDLSGTGWRLDGAGRYLMWDAAPDAGNVTFENFSVNWTSGPRLWNGGGANGNWSTGLNWGGAAPVSGSPLILNGTTRQNNTNDLSGLSAPWLIFNNGGFAVYGNALTINSVVTNLTGNNALNGPVTLGGAVRLQSEAGNLTLGGSVTGSGQNLTVNGAGNTTINGAIATGSGTVTKQDSGTLTLGGANTYTGNTTISAGTLAVGASGSIASPTITLATGATLDASAGFAIGGSQTLGRNANSGVGNITGPMAFDSGAQISLLANGTSGTVGTLAVTGNLTLHSNTVKIDVSGAALGTGTYPLLTFTGTRSGSVNLAPNITGLGLGSGLVATIVQTSGTISLKVSKAQTNSVFRVMSYNIHFGIDQNGTVDTTGTANFILANNVDLVALNEVDRFRARSDGRDLIAELSQKTGMPYIFSNDIPDLSGDDQFGNAILSKFPILYRNHILLPQIGSLEQRGILQSVVDVKGKFISFWSTHLGIGSDSTERLMAVTNFNNWVADQTFPTIVCGDFNETPDKVVHTRMESKWDDIWLVAGTGLGRTSPCPGPVQTRIDYIWRAQNWFLTPTNPWVDYTIEESDHYPIITDFVLTMTTNHARGFYFPCNEGTGTNVVDSIGNLKGILDTGTPSWNTNSPTGQAGDYSLWFNGNKQLTITDKKQILGTNGFNDDYTLQAWVKVAVNYAPTERAILFQCDRRPGFSFSINTNRTLHTTAFKVQDISSSATLPNDGLWHHVAVVHTDGVNMKFYIDAALAATVAYTNGAGYRTESTITMGAASDGANKFTGFLDRVGFENRALTPAEFDYPAGSSQFGLNKVSGSGNGIEIWKASYGLSDLESDADGDGQSNRAEYTAGTNPTNATSAFKIVNGTRLTDGRISLTWSSMGGKRYRVQYSDDLGRSFTDIGRDAASETDASPAGEESTQTFIDSSAPSNQVRFYRVIIIP